MQLTKRHIKNFWCKVNKQGPVPAHKPELGPCWTWTGALQSKGYGSISINKKTYNAHRVSFVLAYGYEPGGLVMHKCDNRRCVNPGHLQEGTQLDNVRDMIEKGRANLTGLKNVGSFSKIVNRGA